jgi:thioredoxin 1
VPVLVDFYATWCGPCKRVAPVLDSAASKLQGKVRFLKVNVDKCHNVSDQYDIRSMPTALLFEKGGALVDRKIGLGPILRLLEDLEER